jgi:hypothetical protein
VQQLVELGEQIGSRDRAGVLLDEDAAEERQRERGGAGAQQLPGGVPTLQLGDLVVAAQQVHPGVAPSPCAG